jgi:predicted ABC-type ATPase
LNESHSHIIVLAGPNGAGKSTTAPALIEGALGVTEFVNADMIVFSGEAIYDGILWNSIKGEFNV